MPGTTVLRIDPKNLLKEKIKDQDLIDQLPSTLVALGEDDPGPPPPGSMRLCVAPLTVLYVPLWWSQLSLTTADVKSAVLALSVNC